MEELKGFEKNIKMFEDEFSKIENLTDEEREKINIFVNKYSNIDNLTDEELENFNNIKEKLSKMEQLTDDELENIAGGVSENIEPNSSGQNFNTFLILAGWAAIAIHNGSLELALNMMNNIGREYRDTIIVSYLREEFKNKFGFDPYTRR